MARNGIVATSQPLAAQAGLRILMAGGNAIDAAVAAAAVLNLVEPMSVGVGGDLFAIFYIAKDKKLYQLNASGMAPDRRDHRALQQPRLFLRPEELGIRLRHARLRDTGRARAQRCLGLGRGLAEIRHYDVQGSAPARHRLRGERLPDIGGDRRCVAPAQRGQLQREGRLHCTGPRFSQNMVRRRKAAEAGRRFPQPRPGPHLPPLTAARPGGVLQGRDRARHRCEICTPSAAR